MRHYFFSWLIATGALLLAVAAFNFVVDPYNLFQVINQTGFNAIKLKAGTHVAMTKPYQVLRVQPHALILGNSRAEVGFDPEHPAWPDQTRPVFNLALPGTGVSAALRHLQHVLAGSHGNEASAPKMVLVGIDLMDFLVDSDSLPQHAAMPDEDRRLLTRSDGSNNPSRPMQEARDYAASVFSLAAFFDSVQTVLSQNNLRTKDRTQLGFNPMRDYLKVTAVEGYWAVFRQADITNMQNYLARPKDLVYKNGRLSFAVENLQRIIDLCRNHGIVLHLIIYPYHAHLLEIMQITGHWNVLQDWKRLLASIVDAAASAPRTSPVVLWDFADYNEITSENIPSEGDLHTTVRWYWEAGHFKKALGDLILDHVLTNNERPDQYGVVLNSANVEMRIEGTRIRQSAYRESHSADVKELEYIAEKFRRSKRTL